MNIENTIIIGGGPTGLSAAIYNARAELNPLVIAGSPPGGQLTLTSDVENYPGFLSVLGPDLITKMREHAEHFGTRFVDDNVKEVITRDGGFEVVLSDGASHRSKSVLIATGASALWLELENEQRLRGKGVSACATCDGFFFKEKVVAVVGGGDTAMEEALTMTKFAQKVFLIHRKDTFRASKIMQKRVLEHEKIEVLYNSEIIDVKGQDKVEGVEVITTNDDKKEKRTLDVNGLFLAIGHKPSTEFLKGSEIMMNKKGYVTTSAWAAWEEKNGMFKGDMSAFDFQYQYATSVKGIFAAGDCVDYLYRQAGSAVGMGIAAALEVERYLSDE